VDTGATHVESSEQRPGTVCLRLPLRWRDLDTLGHLTHSVYHDFLAEGRVAALTSAGAAGVTHFVLARVELNHRHEVRHRDGFVEVEVSITRVGRSSVTVSHELRLPDGTVSADGSSVLVGWDPAQRRSRELGPEERTQLSAALA
jgi:acyl-CoA thioester hydrolase